MSAAAVMELRIVSGEDGKRDAEGQQNRTADSTARLG